MPAAAVVPAAAGLAGGIISGIGNNKAASTAADASKYANQLQYNQWLTQQQNQAPWLQAGTQAINTMGAGMAPGGQFTQSFDMSKFAQDPGYAFRLAEGQKALERSGAARGMTLSGSQLRGLTDYGQGMASQEYANAYNRWNNDQNTQWNRLSGLAGTGQQANSQLGQIGMNTANQMGNNMMGAATVAGNAAMSNASNWANALNTGVNSWQQYQLAQQMTPNYGAANNAYGAWQAQGPVPYAPVAPAGGYYNGQPIK